MTKQLRPIALAACIATFPSVCTSPAQAKQQCHVAMPSDPHGQWWSYRLIDGRKCWYEGKPMLSKSELEWSRQTSANPDSTEVVASVRTDKPSNPKPSNPNPKPTNPMNAQARAPADVDSFDARWRARIEQAILEELSGIADRPRRPVDRRL
jgi:hypothetical protein